MISGALTYLRALEPADAQLLYDWENDLELWCGGTTKPISLTDIKLFIEHSELDIYQSRELRLMIVETESGTTVGNIDLYDFDPFHLHGSIGIMLHKNFRGRGLATDAIGAFTKYLFEFYGIRALCATTAESNTDSAELFTRCNFKLTGRRPCWLRNRKNYEDELIFTLTP